MNPPRRSLCLSILVAACGVPLDAEEPVLPSSSVMVSDTEDAKSELYQKTIRESYDVLNGDYYEYAEPLSGRATQLPEDLFEKKLGQDAAPTFYSRDGVIPSAAIKRLMNPTVGTHNRIECNIAQNIVYYQLLIAALGGVRQFDLFSNNASQTMVRLANGAAAQISPRILLGNRVDQSEIFARDLLIATRKITDTDSFNVNDLKVGTGLAIANDAEYYERHPHGRFGGNNVIFYEWKTEQGRKVPLFYGFRGMFLDRNPHTLVEIQVAMLNEYLRDPKDSEVSAARKEKSEKHVNEIRRKIEESGIEKVAPSICKPKMIRTIVHDKVSKYRTQ